MTSRNPKFLQFNALFVKGKEALLRDTLFKTLEPLFPKATAEEIRAVIEAQLKKGFDLKKYVPDIQAGKGNFCENCVESRCCTISDPVVLYPDDVKRLEQHGLKDFKRLVVRRDGEIIEAIAHSAPCMFLDSGGRCTIYKIRPFACFSYPISKLDTGENIFLLPLDCQIGWNLMLRQIIEALKSK